MTFTCGTGEPVLLVCGLGGLGQFWAPVMTSLAGGNTLIAFDHPGVGRSDPVSEQCIEGIVQASLGVLDRLGFHQAHVVGHSTGGLVAQALALDHPERVGKIVLSSTWARPDRRFRDVMTFRKEVLGRMGLSSYRRLGNLLGYPDSVYHDLVPQVSSGELTGKEAEHQRLIAARIDMLLGYERADALDEITVPTLVIGAEDDWLIPLSHAEELARSIAGARLRVLSGGHFTPQVRSEDYAKVLRDFLS